MTLTTPCFGGCGTFQAAINSLGVGDAATFTLVVDALVSTRITNTAFVVSTSSDVTPANDTAIVVTNDAADVSITKVDSPDPVAPGGQLTYTITVSNLGPSGALSVNVSDVPGGTTFVSATQTSGPAFTFAVPPS